MYTCVVFRKFQRELRCMYKLLITVMINTKAFHSWWLNNLHCVKNLIWTQNLSDHCCLHNNQCYKTTILLEQHNKKTEIRCLIQSINLGTQKFLNIPEQIVSLTHECFMFSCTLDIGLGTLNAI